MHIEVEEKLKKLQAIKQLPFPILSVYLSAPEKKTPTAQLLLSEFHSLTSQKLTKAQKSKLRHNIDKIESYLIESSDTRGIKTVAIFSANYHLWEVLELEFYIPCSLSVSHAPYLKPVLEELKKRKKYFVLLVDRAKARFFTVHLGKIEEHQEFSNPTTPQKVRASNLKFYGRSNKIFRHIEDHLSRHLTQVASRAAEFFKEATSSFIILGSHEELLHKIKKYLPKKMADKIAGTFVTELNIPLNKIYLESKKIASQISSV